MQEILIFANPIAGRGRGRAIAQRLEARLHADGYKIRLLLKKPESLEPDDLGDMPNSPQGPKAAIVIGGDGTLRAVAQRALWRRPAAAYFATGDGQPDGPAPGSQVAGRNARRAGQSSDRRGRVLLLDAGRVNGKLFLLMVGVGYDAAVVHELHRVRKGPIGYANYVLPAAMALTEYRFPRLRVTVDSAQVFDEPPRHWHLSGMSRSMASGSRSSPRPVPTTGCWISASFLQARRWT